MTVLPPWGERLLDRIEEAPKEKRRARPAVGLKFPVEWVTLIQAAAKKRDLTMAAYARRALMAFVCHDLGLDWPVVMSAEPAIGRYNHDAKPERKAGEQHGSWEIKELR